MLDLFAGTGQLGIEALSRGAAEAVFVDRRPDAVRLVQENLALCGFTDRARVKSGDALAYLKSGEKFDLIFLDPPYASGLLQQALTGNQQQSRQMSARISGVAFASMARMRS